MCRKEKLPSILHFQLISDWKMSPELQWGVPPARFHPARRRCPREVEMDQRMTPRAHRNHPGERVESGRGAVRCHVGKNRHEEKPCDEFVPSRTTGWTRSGPGL